MLRAQRAPASGRLHLKGGSCTRMNIQLGKLPFPAHPPTLQPVSSKRIAPAHVRRLCLDLRDAKIIDSPMKG